MICSPFGTDQVGRRTRIQDDYATAVYTKKLPPDFQGRRKRAFSLSRRSLWAFQRGGLHMQGRSRSNSGIGQIGRFPRNPSLREWATRAVLFSWTMGRVVVLTVASVAPTAFPCFAIKPFRARPSSLCLPPQVYRDPHCFSPLSVSLSLS